MPLHDAFEPLILVLLGARTVDFCGISRRRVEGGLAVFTVPRVDADKIKNIP